MSAPCLGGIPCPTRENWPRERWCDLCVLCDERDAARGDLAFLRDAWSPVGARACPACVYEGGVYVRACKVHTYADALRAEVERLRDALVVVLPMAKGYAAAHDVGSNAEMIAEAEMAVLGAAPKETT